MRQSALRVFISITLIFLILNGYELLKIRQEIRGVQKLLSMQDQLTPAAKPPQQGKLRLEGGYSIGSISAPVTIVEFTDYQCPYCRQFQNTTFETIRKLYVETGKVRFVIRDLPLGIHPDAMRAAVAAHCAGDQGQFWAMHDALIADPNKLAQTELVDDAKSLKLDLTAFASCLKSGKHEPEIQNDVQVASTLGINGTPSFLIGKAKGVELSGSILIGAPSLKTFETIINQTN